MIKGSNGNQKLNECLIGLISVTKDNTEKPWILFEAGALSNKLEKSKVCPILFGIKKSEIKGSLSKFQLTEFLKEDFFKLVKSINNSFEKNRIEEALLFEVFETFYPKFEMEVKLVLEKIGDVDEDKPLRKNRGILEEILNLARKQYLYVTDEFSFYRKKNDFFEPEGNSLGIEKGDWIEHPKYGIGRVVKLENVNNLEEDIVVSFNEYGVKKLLARFSGLKKYRYNFI